jgi:RsiW-degrading membrane proteinase PrsW (M82 family)
VNVLYVTLLVLATFVWGYIFYKKEYHPQPLKIIAQIFGIGLFAMIPVFAYKYIYQHYLPILSENKIFSPLLESSLLSGLFFFIINLTLLSCVLFTISAIVTGLLTRFNHDTLTNIKKAMDENELGFVTVSMMIGLLVYLESFVQKTWDVPILNTILGALLFLTIIEEFVKHLMVQFVDDKKLKDVDDAITLSIMVGLAFGFIETIIYALVTGELSLLMYRAFLSIPVHLISSGIFGYFYGLSHFAKPITNKTVGEKTYRLNIKWLHKILTLKRSTLYEDEKMVEGLGLAVLFHGTCNVLFELNLAYIAIPILVIGLIIISYLYKESRIFYRMIHAH